eukprot:tig00020510_g9889.t1
MVSMKSEKDKEKMVLVRDVETGAELQELPWPRSGQDMNLLALSQDGRHALFRSGHAVRVLNLEEEGAERRLENCDLRNLRVSLSADGRWAASTGGGGNVLLWDLVTGESDGRRAIAWRNRAGREMVEFDVNTDQPEKVPSKRSKRLGVKDDVSITSIAISPYNDRTSMAPRLRAILDDMGARRQEAEKKLPGDGGEAAAEEPGWLLSSFLPWIDEVLNDIKAIFAEVKEDESEVGALAMAPISLYRWR